MANEYNFSLLLDYEPKAPGKTHIDLDAKYGFWEYRDGTEGGGLWFEPFNPTTCEFPEPETPPEAPSRGLMLADFDGWYILPAYVAKALREAGFYVSKDYDWTEVNHA